MNRVNSYIVNLDLPPEERWIEIIKDHEQYFPDVEEQIDQILREAGVLGGIVKGLVSMFSAMGKVMYKKELQSISNMTGIPLSKIVLMQICYEMFSACTSVVIRGKSKNYHFRTMDWEMNFLRNLTVNVTFTKGGRKLFNATTWAGYVGIVTGMNDRYSLALNYRRANGSLIGNVWRTMAMKWPVGYLIRYVLENGFATNKAYQTICSYKLISPCYITFCMATSSARIVIRDCDKVFAKKKLEDKGYLIQTNHDYFDGPENDIMFSYARHKKAKNIIRSFYSMDNNKKCKHVNRNNIMKNFHIKPIINEFTVYSTLMIPKNYHLESYVVRDYRYVNGNVDQLVNIDEERNKLNKLKQD